MSSSRALVALVLVLLAVCYSAYSARHSVLPPHHPIYHSLHHFEPLHVHHIHHTTHRDNMPRATDNLRELSFHSMGRRFQLFLSPSHHSFHKHIDSLVTHHDGSQHRVPIQYNQFMRGHVFGEISSHVIAHVTDEGVVTAIIDIGEETYYIEPSYRHIQESHDFHMIVYKGSDVKFNFTSDAPVGGKFCGSTHSSQLHGETLRYKLDGEAGNVRDRLKRQSGNPSTDRVCKVRLLTTPSFDSRFNAGSDNAATNYLLLLLSRIDMIFQRTQFHIPGFTDSAPAGTYGMQIERVELLDGFQTAGRSSQQILSDLDRMNVGEVCLVHLFSGDSFSDGLLGLAYISSPQRGSLGGICSPVVENFNGQPFFSGQTGVSSIMSGSRLLLMAEVVQVTGHEFGHNWGSFHDPNTEECNPSSTDGKYLMYEFAQNGIAPNNMVFSNCSIRAITRVINSRSDIPEDRNCLEARSMTLCGNYQVDGDETCDVGPDKQDMCCDNCRLRPSRVCSDVNNDCCSNCAVIPASEGRICDMVAANNQLCRGNTTCSGEKNCPTTPPFLPENTPCGVNGTCLNSSSNDGTTVCRDVCFRNNMVLCYCRGDNECKVCCQPNSTATSLCTPLNGGSTNLPDGSFCEGGTCQTDGDTSRCVPANPDFSAFVFSIIANFDVNAFFQLVRENIVGSILFLTLLIWIPVSVTVHILVDVKRIFDRRAREQKQAAVTDNDSSDDESAPLMTAATAPQATTDESTDGFEFNEEADPERDAITTHLTASTRVP